ncbi:DUF881 domain-containing protein [Phycicoccus ginsengisoli]
MDESMTLLTSMMERPLDPGYAAAAERRVAAGLPAATGFSTPIVVVASAVVGLLLTFGAIALRAPSTAAARAKADIVSQIETRRAAADRQETALRTTQADIDRLRKEALGSQQAALQAELDTLTLVSGSEAATGKGITLVLDNAPGSESNSADGNPRTTSGTDEGKVYSKDLQIVVNGLWQAGAEAIAVNGQRLTSRSAIRFAGEAILVNYRPLTRPYRIQAIGDPSTLQTNFAENAGGSYARALHDNYGIRVSMDSASSLTLPAAASLSVDKARVLRPEATATPTPTRSGKGSPTTTPSGTPSTSETSP